MLAPECGLIFLDEADKLGHREKRQASDINGRGVQIGLLILMETAEIDLRTGHDLQSQLQTALDIQRGKSGHSKISQKPLVVIVRGACRGLEDNIQRRIRRSTLGFQANHSR